MANEVIKGTVKWFDIRKGFGFVTDENGKDVFIHFSGISRGRHYIGLNEGDTIQFSVKAGKKGPEVSNAELVQDDKAEAAPEDTADADDGSDRVVYSTETPAAAT